MAGINLTKEEKLARYREMNRTAEKGGILFAGSSLMEMYPVERFAAERGYRVINRGVGGFVTDELLEHIDTCILDLKPSALFINIGTNDLSRPERSIAEVMERYGEILARTKAALPGIHLYLMAYYPVNPEAASEEMKACLRIRTNAKLLEANREVEKLARAHGAVYLDVNAPLKDGQGRLKAEYTLEGMHISEEGYRAIHPLVETWIEKETLRMKTVQLGFLGCGNIGGGVWHLLNDMHDAIACREGLDLRVKKALVKSIPEARTDVPQAILTESADDVLLDPEIRIVCEYMGGEQPAASFMLRALEAGKTVVTANKMALALHWEELQAAAKAHGAQLFYEASVGGVIPIIRSLTVSLAADRLDTVMGIVNGTTNYILTRMAEEGSAYADVLADAQRLGLAEPNPAADVEGLDAAYKLSIMSSIAFHGHVPFERVYREGITGVTPEDIACGREMGYTLKLLAIGKRRGDEVEARVHPTFLPSDHPLSRVAGSLNAVYVHGAYCQDMMLQGRGAGDKPTASAICGDILCAARGDSAAPKREEAALTFAGDWTCRYFIRLSAIDAPGVLASVASSFGREGVSIATMLQKGADGEGRARLIFITHEAHECAMRRALEAIDPAVAAVESMIRVEA